jgi:hypothetical protein
MKDVVDMASFSISALSSDIVPDMMTDGSDRVVLVRRYGDGTVTVAGGNSTSVTSGTGTTTMHADGATINLLTPGIAQVVLGATPTTMKFINMGAITLTGGAARATIIADNGSNTFIAGGGALTIAGGSGINNYVYHVGSALMTIEDFSVAKGDVLKIDKSLQGPMRQISDGQGGTMLTFGSAATGIDVKGIVALPSTSINWI